MSTSHGKPAGNPAARTAQQQAARNAQIQNEHAWSAAWIDIMQGGMAPEAAAEKAFKRVEEIFAKYPIA